MSFAHPNSSPSKIYDLDGDEFGDFVNHFPLSILHFQLILIAIIHFKKGN